MNPEEIRALSFESGEQLMPTEILLGEIAAQLAEQNDSIVQQDHSSRVGLSNLMAALYKIHEAITEQNALARESLDMRKAEDSQHDGFPRSFSNAEQREQVKP